ncbi:uncharacterized protein LOC111356295 [Spodoptera litura]|uniref:Uncharacterized protein LOC111356295 n=1 Tax=Spodoptera litura TaxID=69820 RepID=A0A9J7IUM6_SPOLT|nr:uncharacterized protein LOC111356295 [Spodoptera litura]
MDSPPRQDSPVHFSKYFTDENLQMMTEIIENSDEEKSAHDNDDDDPVLSPPEVNSYDPILAPAPIMLQSPNIMSNISSGIENDVSIESPNFSSIIAKEIAQLESGISPVPTTPLSLPVNSPMPIETQLSSPRHRQYARKQDKGRLRLVHKDQWLDVMRKKNKNLGNAYKSRDGKSRNKREMGPSCGEKCKLKCSQKITDIDRNLLFVAFWSMGDIVRHWDYINKYCEKINKRRVTTETASRREFTLRYYLPTKTHMTDSLAPNIQTLKIQVCKTMFLNTFGIKQGLVYSALKKLSLEGTVAHDKRGIHLHTKKITEEIIASVCDHVNSFAPVESHYVRKRSDKVYLDGSLTFAKMFLLYKDWNDPKNQNKAQTARQYRDIINSHINLGFHIPKKDQCDVCHVYKNLLRPVSEEQFQIYKTHMRNKTIAREFKIKDKECSLKSNDVLTAVYDFQKVHGMPYGETSILYYKRKLTVFNFTVYEMGSRVAKCYVWDESTANRGANEVSSCLYNYIKEHHQKGIKIFNFWSDNCGGQNRNRIVFAAYLRAAKVFQVTITHKYFEKGHTQNEGDSVHALIERTAKNKMVYTPDQWYALIRWAKQDGRPYLVQEMTTSDFIDFKALLPGCNWTVNTNRERVFWSQLRQLEIRPESTDRIHYKIDFCEHEFKCIIVNNVLETPKTRSRNRLREDTSQISDPLLRPLTQAYKGKLPIPKAKLQDLKYLCQNNIIPSIYHDFYMSLIEDDNDNEHDKDEEDEEEE